jgi:hypothetical protein
MFNAEPSWTLHFREPSRRRSLELLFFIARVLRRLSWENVRLHPPGTQPVLTGVFFTNSTRMDQSNAKRILREERVYEIDKTASGAYRPLVVAITSKTSAQRLMAQLAEERGLQDQGRYRMFAFTHPTLPGLER